MNEPSLSVLAPASEAPAPVSLALPLPAEESWPLGLTVGVTSVGHAVCHLAELLFPGVMVAVMHEFHLGPAMAGALALLGYVLMGVGAFPVGLWCDAWGPTRVLGVYFLAVAGACTAVIVAPGVWTLFLALTMVGLAVSLYHPAGLALLSLQPRSRGRALGIHGVAGSVGVTLGPFLGLWASGLGVWRLAYGLVAGVALLAGLVFLLVARFYPAVHVRHRPAPIPENGEAPAPVNWGQYLPLTLFMLAMMVGGFNYRCLVTALPTFLTGGTGQSGELARGSLPVLIALAAGGLGQLLSGWTADTLGARRVYLVVMALMIPLSLTLGQLAGSPWALPVACLVAVCLFGQQPAENSLLAEMTPAGRRGLSYATKFTLTFGVGAAGTAVTGLIWKYAGSLGPVFALIACGAGIMVVCWLAALASGAKPQAAEGAG
jgi:MFS family permease